MYIEKEINEDLQSEIYNDIWSIVCILYEMFFVVYPIFQTFSLIEKMKKNLEILGVILMLIIRLDKNILFLQSTERNLKNKIRLLDLINNKNTNENGEEHNSIFIKNNIFNILNRCLLYNRKNRISIDNLIKESKILMIDILKKNQLKME